MKVLICEETRPLLEEYHDDELPVGDQIAVRAHLEWCDECSAVFADLRLMRGFVRAAAPGQVLPEREDRDTFQATVISRARAEERVSWSARLRDVLDDTHILYAGLGAAAATVFCVLILLSMMRFATRERPDSLAAIVSLLASPKVEKVDENAPGTNKNPVVVDARMLMPRALDQLFLAAASATDESAFTLSAVVTREGRLLNLEWHSPSGRTPKAGSTRCTSTGRLCTEPRSWSLRRRCRRRRGRRRTGSSSAMATSWRPSATRRPTSPYIASRRVFCRRSPRSRCKRG